MNPSFEGKISLVTGGGSGIGQATALSFARAGAKVVVADIAEASGLGTVNSIRQQGGEAIFVKADVTRDNDVAAMVAKTVETWGRLDCAFNNAGIEEEHMRLADCSEATFDNIIGVNVKGVWLCLKHEIAQMLKQGGGAIVNAASVAGLKGAFKMSAYSASKHAVLGLTKSAALDYARKNIRVNAVCPAVIRTPMLERAMVADPKGVAGLAAKHPVGRLGEAEEVAAAVLWLCSDAVPFVTGHPLAVDGGLMAL
jgi:NAD(P)-dependent dehydrogenase (short-subunit alcohol dehydrogenase family)